MFLEGQPLSIPGERGPSVPKFLGSPTYAHTVREPATKCCMVIKLDARKIFTGASTNADTRSVGGS